MIQAKFTTILQLAIILCFLTGTVIYPTEFAFGFFQYYLPSFIPGAINSIDEVCHYSGIIAIFWKDVDIWRICSDLGEIKIILTRHNMRELWSRQRGRMKVIWSAMFLDEPRNSYDPYQKKCKEIIGRIPFLSLRLEKINLVDALPCLLYTNLRNFCRLSTVSEHFDSIKPNIMPVSPGIPDVYN